MTGKKRFRGSIEVRSVEGGYQVTFKVETDAHDLGHALVAIIDRYADLAQQQGAGEADELKEIVMEGIACGMKSPPELQRHH